MTLQSVSVLQGTAQAAQACRELCGGSTVPDWTVGEYLLVGMGCVMASGFAWSGVVLKATAGQSGCRQDVQREKRKEREEERERDRN